MNMQQFIEFVEALPREEQEALLNRPEVVREYTRRFRMWPGCIFGATLTPDLVPNPVERLLKIGAYENVEETITDDRFKVVLGDVKRRVRYRIFRGYDLRATDGWVRRRDVELTYKAEGGRAPEIEEALLAVGSDHSLGRSDHPLVMPIPGSSKVLVVHEHDGKRYLDKISCRGEYNSYYNFLMVYYSWPEENE